MDTNSNNSENSTSNNQETQKLSKWTFEKKALGLLSAIFAIALLGAWGFALQLKDRVAANNAIAHADASALIKVERLRHLAESQLDDGRAFFLWGAQSLYEKHKEDRSALLTAIAGFEKDHNLPEVPVQLKRIRDLSEKAQDFFEQGMEFREKKSESKIVGQFYQSKTTPVRTEINQALDEIVKIHQAELDRNQNEAREAALSAETQIPVGMIWLTIFMGLIFGALAFLILRLVRRQEFQVAQQNRLYAEAKKAVQDRDETIFAISHDLKDSLNMIASTADRMSHMPQGIDIVESGELVKSTVTTIEGLIQDIRDKKAVEMEGITLRLDQLPIDKVLDNARLLMQPLAKQHDVRLQIDTVNPPVLAFYDNERVLRVLSNLISNAIKFSHKGEKVVVKVRSDQKFVNVSVVDTGAGIPANQVEGIFDNFWQAKKTADQGAGVGLAIVKTIVEAHGGTVEVQSQLGRGTTVTFSLPRRRPVGANLKKSALTVRQHAHLLIGLYKVI